MQPIQFYKENKIPCVSVGFSIPEDLLLLAAGFGISQNQNPQNA
jgi:hypothetical protein